MTTTMTDQGVEARSLKQKIAELDDEKLTLYINNMSALDTIAYELWVDKGNKGLSFFEPEDVYSIPNIEEVRKLATTITDALWCNGYFIRKEVTIL